jgi:serine/threonine-protein kinase
VSGSDLSGEVLEDRYQIQERLAEGAMGVVYRGTRLKLDRAVAIKVMHAVLPAAMEGRKRFEREAKLMARLEHPHCVSIIDVGMHGAKPYVVMELVRGRSLHDLLVEQGRFEPPRAIEIMRQLLSGLAHAHDQGIIHRDIKPANIMVTPKAPLGLHVRILDFGLARMLEASTTTSTSNGVTVGTPSYMAPEQCRGEKLDGRVDIYACGVVLFEMLTGKKPFIASDPIAICKMQVKQEPPRLADVASGDYGELETVVARALAKSPADRYPTAVAMAEALEAATSGRIAPEPTLQFAPITDDDDAAAAAAAAAPRSVDVPITVGSSVHTKPEPPSSSVHRELPRSRARFLVLGGILIGAAAVAGLVIWQQRLATNTEVAGANRDAQVTIVTNPAPVPVEPPATPSDPADDLASQATQLAADGKVQAAIDMLVKARKVYPDRAVLALTVGKLYLAKMWWNDGLLNLRDAIKLDPALKSDPELVKLAIKGFLTTPSYDGRLGRFVEELGPSVVPTLEEAARSHPSPQRRKRAESMLRRIKPTH